MPANQQVVRAAVSVSQMAKMLGLSRSRFYELMTKGVFLTPIYSIATKRAFFPREMQERNLQVRVEQLGINGEFVLFQERRPAPQVEQSARSPRRRDGRAAALVQGLKSLGIETADAAVVDRALAACYPQGTNGTDETTILRTVFRYLRRSGTV
jgi:predicted DNA-binding transcriptional regulator AlpA